MGIARGAERVGRRARAWGLWLLACAFSIAAHAGLERYDYDALGRLIRVIDEQNQVTEYRYDAVGNILQVISAGTMVPLSVSSISPAVFRRGDVRPVVVVGTNLLWTSVTAADPALDITDVRSAAGQIDFVLGVGTAAALGPGTLTIRSAAGSASAAITIAPVLPRLTVEPTPLAIPPDNTSRQFTLRLSSPDTIDHTVGLSASNANIAVSPSSVTFPSGQTSATAGIKGVTEGQSSVMLNSATLGNSAVPVYVTGDFAGLNTSFAPPLGVVLTPTDVGAPPPVALGPVVSGVLGVVTGDHLLSVAPKVLQVGSGPQPLSIAGAGLVAAQSVAVIPADGLTLGSLAIAADGKSATVPITVAADAQTTRRQLVLRNTAGQAFTAASPEADRFDVVPPRPEILSMDPLFGTPGTTLTLTIRGNNLTGAQQVVFQPEAGIATSDTPTISADGKTLTTPVTIPPAAPIGAYAVSVVTAGGSSSSTAGDINTFRVVNEIQGAVTPVVSPLLGVVVESQGGSGASPLYPAYSRPVGVAVGSVATGIAPAVGIIGETLTVTVQGVGLQGVTAVQLLPSTGLVVGSPTVAGDGASLSFTVTIDPAAPQALRTVKLLAGATAVPFASPGVDLFLVSAPVPRIESVTPNVWQTGQSGLVVTVRGRDLKTVTGVRLEPADGVSFSTPVIDAKGIILTASANIAAGTTVGPRALILTNTGGDSSLEATPANTVTLSATAGQTYTPVVSSLLGVVYGNTATPETSTTLGPFVSPQLGIIVGEPAPVSTAIDSFARPLGVAVGPVIITTEPPAFIRGATGILTFHGQSLDGATAISINPASGITLGTLAASPDGSTLQVSVSVAADAALGARDIVISNASGRIPYANSTAPRLKIGVGVPTLDSITPILANQGDRVALTLRGGNFTGATAVRILPSEGIQMSSTPVVDVTGTQITVDFAIAANAPLGARIIQVLVPGAESTADPIPANTFTIYAP